jgi:hypothetical protein
VYQKPLKIDDLDPDKVKVIVSWGDMVIGASVFIPCINTEKAKQQMEKIAEDKSWQVAVRVCIENGMFGVRIWRIV